MEYKNFDLYIDSEQEEKYKIAAKSETMGDAFGDLLLQPDWLDTAQSLKNVAQVEIDSARLTNFGTSLHKSLFCDGVGDLLRVSMGSVLLNDEQGVRIRLMISPPEIASLPWETLYDQRTKCFLSTSGKTPLTRFIRIFEPIKSLKITPPVRVLVLIPSGSGLDVEIEKRIITEALRELKTVELTILEGKVTRSRISEALTEKQYHILHFIGHGVFESNQGYLLLNSEEGKEAEGDNIEAEGDKIPADAFADFFRDYPSLKLVVLNSCQGAEVSSTEPLVGMAPQLVMRGIPAVIAMQYPISDKAALLFSKEFYLKLCKGWSRGQVDAAISHARNRIHMDIDDEPLAFATPALFMRSSTGVIFDIDQAPPGAQDAADAATRHSPAKSLWQKLTTLFTSQPIKNINRLNELKKTYQQNIEAWQELQKDAHPAVAAEAAQAITQEQKELSAVDDRIARWDRTFAASLVATVLIFLLGYVGLFNFPFHLDDWLESRFIPYMDAYVVKKFNPDIRLIMADEDENEGMGVTGPEWRKYHAELVKALAEAKAKVVIFDLYMDEPSPHDQQLAEAVRQASAQGTQVVIGKALDEDGNVIQGITSNLQDAFKERWGNIKVGGQRGGFVRVYQLAQPDRQLSSSDSQPTEVPIIPSLGLQAVNLYLSKDARLKAFFNEDTESIQLRSDGTLVKSIPVRKTNQALYDFPYDLAQRSRLSDATRSYSSVYRRINDPAFLSDYRGKIVLVGYKTPDEILNVLQGEKRYGTEIHANVISNILSGVYISLLPSSYDFLIVALMAALGALAQARFKNVFSRRFVIPLSEQKKTIDVPGLLLVVDVVYLLIAFLIYKNELMFIVKSYHLAAPFIAYWLTGKMRKRINLKLR
ncbi:MAG TPA: CHASE2 domain-containing protein [Pyrinomonadaceae bacterium]|jgi:CHASE2 domain-containing sensor protein|nr:CHASE2 domain-containing protein [Pyrinomonadaceae bacterium]